MYWCLAEAIYSMWKPDLAQRERGRESERENTGGTLRLEGRKKNTTKFAPGPNERKKKENTSKLEKCFVEHTWFRALLLSFTLLFLCLSPRFALSHQAQFISIKKRCEASSSYGEGEKRSPEPS